MGRRTRKDNEQYVETYYGIDPKTHKVVSVSKTRGGTLIRWDSETAMSHRHPIAPGRMAQSEVVVVYGLRDVFCVTVGFEDGESTKRRIAELEKKAEEMRKEAEDNK